MNRRYFVVARSADGVSDAYRTIPHQTFAETVSRKRDNSWFTVRSGKEKSKLVEERGRDEHVLLLPDDIVSYWSALSRLPTGVIMALVTQWAQKFRQESETEERLYVWTSPSTGEGSTRDERLDIYRYKPGVNIGDHVDTATVYTDDSGTAAAAAGKQVVIKQAKRTQEKLYRHAGTRESALETVKRIVASGESTMFREHALHAILQATAPENIVPLVFPDSKQFTFIDKGTVVVPLKVTYYVERERHAPRDLVKQAEAERSGVENKIQKALNDYYRSATDERARDEDWRNERNRLYHAGHYLFFDFDQSV